MRRLPPVKKKDAGYYLRVWRAERDLTNLQAAALFKVSPSLWSLLESGDRHASYALAKELATAVGADVEVFVKTTKRKM